MNSCEYVFLHFAGVCGVAPAGDVSHGSPGISPIKNLYLSPQGNGQTSRSDVNGLLSSWCRICLMITTATSDYWVSCCIITCSHLWRLFTQKMSQNNHLPVCEQLWLGIPHATQVHSDPVPVYLRMNVFFFFCTPMEPPKYAEPPSLPLDGLVSTMTAESQLLL